MNKKKKKKKKIYIPALLGILVVGVLLFLKFRDRHPSPYLTINEMLKTNTICGIDISRYQTYIQWEKVAPQIDFVFIRASSGSRYQDPYFEKHYADANDAGIPTGTYHYFVFNVNGKAQADNFLEAIENNYFELPLVIDVEEHPTYGPSSFNYQTTVKNLKDFIATVEKESGKEMMIYTNMECYHKYIKRYFPTHKLWICSFKGKESLPPQWVFWQKTHTGKVEGVKGHVDINVFNGNHDAWLNYIGKIN
ncbi:MAG: GH25 family lysozyme [Bacteroidales bacterium]|nr:GH25 family lysozyme [Bacteroidales bacterium]